MSTGRVLWMIWCLLWAGSWFVTGLVTLVGVVIFWPLAGLSLLAILLPVGKPVTAPRATCPVCGVQGEPTLLPLHVQAAHGLGATAPQQLGPVGPRPVVIEQPRHAPPMWQAYGPPAVPPPPPATGQ